MEDTEEEGEVEAVVVAVDEDTMTEMTDAVVHINITIVVHLVN